MAQLIRREEALASGELPKYAIGDRVIFRYALNRPGFSPEKLYVCDFRAFGTPARWVWQYTLNWRMADDVSVELRKNIAVLAFESELLSLNEAMYHVTKASVERAELAGVA